MTDFDPALNPDVPTPARARLAAALSSAIDRFGANVFRDPDHLKLVLGQACPDAARDIALVVTAITEEVPQKLLAAPSNSELEALLPRLVQRLHERAAIDRASATWVVRTLTHALALPTAGLEGSDSVRRVPRAPPVSAATALDFAAIVAPRAARQLADAQRDATAQARRVAADLAAHASPVDVGAAGDAKAAVPEGVADEPLPTERADSTDAASAPVASVAAATVERPAEPLPSSAAPIAPAAPVSPASLEAEVPSGATASPEPVTQSGTMPLPGMHPPTHTTGGNRRRPAIGASLLAIVIVAVLVAGRWETSQPPLPSQPPSPVAANSTPAPARESPQATATQAQAPAPIVPAPAQPSTPDAPLDAAATTASTASPPSTAPTAASEPAVPEASVPVAAAPAREPGAPESTAPAPNPQSEAPVTETQSASGSPQPAPSPPASELAADRGEPSQAVRPAAPAIAHIDVPRVVAGKPFDIAIRLAPATSAEVVAIERRVIGSSAGWRERVAVTPAAAMARSRGGALLYPIHSLPASHNLLQFTPIDRQGRRGVPRRIEFRAERPAVHHAAAARCTRATCGSVVAVRELGARTRGARHPGDGAMRAYEVIIRMDDRSIHTVVQPERARIGSRIRMIGNQFVPVATRAD